MSPGITTLPRASTHVPRGAVGACAVGPTQEIRPSRAITVASVMTAARPWPPVHAPAPCRVSAAEAWTRRFPGAEVILPLVEIRVRPGIHVVLARELQGLVVSRVHVANDAMPGSLRNPAQPSLGRLGAVGDHDHAGVHAVSDADTAAWWTEPGGTDTVFTRSGEDGPVGDGVEAVLHGLGLAVGRGDRATVEVVASDDDGRLHLALAHEIVEELAGLSRSS